MNEQERMMDRPTDGTGAGLWRVGAMVALLWLGGWGCAEGKIPELKLVDTSGADVATDVAVDTGRDGGDGVADAADAGDAINAADAVDGGDTADTTDTTDASDSADSSDGADARARDDGGIGCMPSNGGREVCDGKDNDCDGKVDEGITTACSRQQGVCKGTRIACSGGGFGSCGAAEYGQNWQPMETRCDGKDNDCDGVADENDFQAIFAGGHHSCGLDSAGRAFCWGNHASGQLGGSTSQSEVDRPMSVPCV